MNRWTPALASVLLALPLGLVACGGSSGSSTSGGASGATCAPVRGNDLVVMKDDKGSQGISVVIPIVRKDVAKPPLTTALNNITKSLTQEKLVALNRAVSTNNQRPEDAAKD